MQFKGRVQHQKGAATMQIRVRDLFWAHERAPKGAPTMQIRSRDLVVLFHAPQKVHGREQLKAPHGKGSLQDFALLHGLQLFFDGEGVRQAPPQQCSSSPPQSTPSESTGPPVHSVATVVPAHSPNTISTAGHTP